jgi:hypothetical protein
MSPMRRNLADWIFWVIVIGCAVLCAGAVFVMSHLG